VVVEKGDRLIQGCFIKVNECVFEEVEKMPEKNRGGFGTTGR
jgi:dUTPase